MSEEKKKKTLQEQIDERVQAWVKNAASITQGATKQFSTAGYRGNTKEYYDSVYSSISASKKEADTIRKILKDFGSKMGDEYTNTVLGYLDEASGYQDTILKYAKEDYDNFSKYASAQEYEQAIKQAKEYEELFDLDTDAEFSWINEKQAYVDAVKESNDFIALQRMGTDKLYLSYANKYGHAAANRKIAEDRGKLLGYAEMYGIDAMQADTSSLEAEIRERTERANRAKYLQLAPSLEEQAKEDPNFASISTSPVEGVYAGLTDLRGMTDEQKQVWRYYQNTDPTKAEEYLFAIEEDVNRNKGQEVLENIKDNRFLEYLFSIEAGIDQFTSGIKGLFSNGYTPISSTQITSQLIREDLADVGVKLPEWMGGGSLGQGLYDLGTTTANMLPSILVGTIGNAILPGAGSVIGAATLGASAAGNARAEAINLGYDKGTATTYGLLIGCSEATLQYLLGGVSSLGSGAGQKLVTSALGSVDNALFRVASKIGNSSLGKFIVNMLSEGGEEYLQGLLEPAIRNAILDENNEIRLNDPEAIYASILGALSAGFLEGPGIAVSAIGNMANTVYEGRTFAASGQTMELVSLAKNSFAADTVAYKIADKITDKTGAYKIGRLLNAVNATLSEQNKQDIKSALIGRGVMENDANTLAEAMATVVGIDNIEEAQAAILEQGLEINDTVADVMREVILNQDSSVNQRTQPFSDLYNIALQTTVGNKTVSGKVRKGEISKSINATLDRNVTRAEAARREGDFTEGDIAYLNEQAALYDERNMTAEDFILMAERSGLTAKAFANAFRERYLQGTINDEKVSERSVTSYLEETTQRRAYVLGKMVRIENDRSSRETVAEKVNTARKSDSAVKKPSGKVIFESSVKADKRRSISMKALENIASMTGLKIHLYASKVDSNSGVRVYSTNDGDKIAQNGFFDPNTNSIHLDVNAGINGEGVILFTAAHELTHFIAKWSKLQFGVLSDFVAERFNVEGVSLDDMIRNKMKSLEGIASYDKLTTEEAKWQYAKEEVIADSMETMFKSGRALGYLTDLRTQHEGLFNKIRGFFRKFIERIRTSRAYKNTAPQTAEGAIIAQSEKAMKKLEKLFAQAVKDASENYAAAESVGIETDNRMYSKRSVDKNGKNGYDNDRQLNLTEDEEAAILAYKSGGSYLLNAKLREGVTLDEYEQKIVDGLDKALAKLPTYEGKVYRNIQFDGFGDGEARKSFVAGHIIDEGVLYLAYTSSSTDINGYPLDGNFVVHFEIESTSGRNMEGYGNNSESEVLFPRNTSFVVNDIVCDAKGTPTIYLTEATDEQTTTGRGRTQETLSVNHRGQQKVSSDSDKTEVQRLSTSNSKIFEVRSSLSQRNTEGNTNEQRNLQGVQAEVNSDIRYSRRNATDSDGNDLSAEQQEFFKDSKVRDENGNLLVMYHGTPSAGFTKFKSGSYFTQHKWYADIYQNPSASSISSGKTATNPDTYAVYLNIKKPFDTRNKTERDIFYNEYYRKWGTGTDLMESGLPDWLDGMDLQEFLEEMGYDYDGLILDEGGVGGYGEEIVSRGLSYVTFDSSQVKNTTNKAPTSKPDIRYSARIPALNIGGEEISQANVDLYTEKQYNDFGWARANGIMSVEENDIFKEQYANVKRRKHYAPKNANGEYMIAVGEKGLQNVIVFASGSLTNTKISKVIRINLASNSLISELRSDILETERFRRTESPLMDVGFEEEIIGRYTLYDCPTYQERKNGSKQRGIGRFGGEDHQDHQSEQDGTRDSSEGSDDIIYFPRNRSLLAEALDSLAENEIDKKKLTEYKRKLTEVNKQDKILTNLTERKTQLEADKKAGKNVKTDLAKVNNDIVKAKNRIDILSSQLLELEGTPSLKRVLQNAKREAKKKGREAQKATDEKKAQKAKEKKQEQLSALREDRDEKLAALKAKRRESEKKRIEQRTRTETKESLFKVVNELNKLITSPSKEKNVKLDLQPAVVAALEAINFDTVEADKRLEEIRAKMASETNPEELGRLAMEYGRVYEADDRMRSHLEKLREAYDTVKKKAQGNPENYLSEINAILAKIDETIEIAGDTPIRSMTREQLNAVTDLYKMVLHTVRETNKAWKNGKLEDVKADATDVIYELYEHKSLPEELSVGRRGAQSFLWNELVPVYAFERLGSKKLKEYFWEFIRAQNVYATDLDEADIILSEARKKYGFRNWKLDEKFTLKSADNRDFVVTLEHLMSIYAYSKRPQALDHMRVGGFFFDTNELFDDNGVIKTKKGNAQGYLVDDFLLGEIVIKHLTPEQIRYVDEVQAYLTDMGEKGNEVSRKLWGIDIFTEEVYFPLKSAKDFVHGDTEQKQETSLKNDGMTKATVPHASNPIILQKFDNVVADHIERMSKYHAFVLPIDGLNKVLHYGTWVDSPSMSVTTLIRSKFGDAATKYLEQFIRDMNGDVPKKGAVLEFATKAFSNFKKTMVAFSMSTIVQQPTAIVRAMAFIDGKYFTGKKVEKGKFADLYAEMKKYAPIAIIKEIGGFDAGGSGRAVDWLNDDTKRGLRKFLGKIDDASMAGAEFADKIGWMSIWEAVKREIADTHKELTAGSEEFLKAAGERFTEVIVYTQVYDSTLSRSGFMRSQSDVVKMATAFMGEPTLSFNMMAHALTMAKRGKMPKKTAARWIGAVYLSTILASAASSLIYALRDDDDEESYLEKFTDSLLGKLAGDLNPLDMLPFFRDIVSVFDGWDVERSDMTLIKDLKDSIDGLDSEKKSAWRKIEDFAGAIAGILGIPVKNLLRTGREIYNLFENIFDEDAGFGNGEEKEPTYTDYTEYTPKDVVSYFDSGNTSKGKTAVQEIIQAKIKAGDTEKEAKASLRSSFTSYYKPLFKEAYKNGNTSECARIRRLLKDSGLYDNYIETYMDWQKEALKEKYQK